MVITDELREWARNNTVQDKVLTTYPVQHPVHGTVESLLRIANRIDAEHEHGMEERADRYSELRAKMNNCYIELPKDADGEYIHVGDKVTCGASVWEVTGFRFTGGFWGICCTIFNDQGGSGTNVYPPSDLHHHHEPTVEDVLCELLDKVDDDRAGQAEIIAEYAAKLRLAGDAE